MNDRHSSHAAVSRNASPAMAADADQGTSLPAAEPDTTSHDPSIEAFPLQAAISGREDAEAANADVRRTDNTSPRPAASKTKSQHVRDFLRQHPEARNRDVAEALSAYGVTAADVANVKSQQKRKQDAPSKPKRRPRAETPTAAVSSPTATAAPADDVSAGNLSLADLEQAIAFVKQLGGFQRARQAVDLLEQIRQINP